jgi:hypothetical protein
MANGVLKVRVGGAWQAIMNGVQSLLHSFVTFNPESSLTGSRKLTAGTNVTIDTATPGEVKINATGGGSHFPTGLSVGPTPAVGGDIRMSNQSYIYARNAANTADMQVLAGWTDNNIYVGGYQNDSGLVLRSAQDVKISPGNIEKVRVATDGAVTVSGSLTTTGRITAGTDLVTTYPIYPGRMDTGWTQQGTWYLGTHGSYGLYSNTGLCLNGASLYTSHGIYPGREDAAGAIQTSFYLKSHNSYGLYSNTGLYLAGNLWANAVYASNIPTIQTGTWTPFLTADGGASGQTYGIQEGYYIKTGRLVYVQGFIRLTGLGVLNGAIAVGGFPFAASNVSSAYGGIAVGHWAGMNMNVTCPALRGIPNDTRFYVLVSVSPSTSANHMTSGVLTSTSDLTFAGTYMTN